MSIDDVLKDMVDEIHERANALASKTSPDDAARAIDLGRTFGAEPESIMAQLPSWEAMHRAELGSSIIQNNPALSAFIGASPSVHGPLVKDDLGSLDALSTAQKQLQENPLGKARSLADFFAIRGRPPSGAPPERGVPGEFFGALTPNEKGVPQLETGLGPAFESAQAGLYNSVLAWLNADPRIGELLSWIPELHITSGGVQVKPGVKVGNETIARQFTDFLTTASQAGAIPEAAIHAGALPGPKPEPPAVSVPAEAEAIASHLAAGVRPPPGVSTIVDAAEQAQALRRSDLTDQVLAARDATKLASRSPEAMEDFLGALPGGVTRIDPEAFTKVEPEALNIPGLRERLAEGSPGVAVPTNQFLARVPRDVWKEIKDFVAHDEDLTPSEAQALGTAATRTPPGGEPTLDAVRSGAGFAPRPSELGAAPSGVSPEEPFPLISEGRSIGRSQADLRRYEELLAQRNAEDVAFAQRRALAQATLENSAEWRAEAERLAPEVRREVEAYPEIAAYRYFQDGTIGGAPHVSGRLPRIRASSLTEEQRQLVPPRFVTRLGGSDIRLAAELFGYTPDQLAVALAGLEKDAVPGRADIVDRLVQAELRERLQAQLGPSHEERLAEVQDHALGLTQMELLHEQMLRLAERAGGIEAELSPKATREGARRLLNEEPFGVTRDQLLRLSGSFARKVESALLRGDAKQAFQAAQAQFVAAQMAIEARAFGTELRTFRREATKYWRRFTPTSPSPIPSEYVAQVQDLLARVGGGRAPLALTPPKESLRDFVLKKQASGRDIRAEEFLLAPGFGAAMDKMNIGQARAVMATVKDLIANGRAEGRILVEGKRSDFATFLAKAREQVAQSANRKVAKERAWLGRALGQFQAQSLQVPTMLNRFDQGKARGPLQEFALRRVIASQGREFKLDKEVGDAIAAIGYKGDARETIPNTLFKSPREAFDPATGKFDWGSASPIPMTRGKLLSIMHNLGNADNLERLATGFGLTPREVWDYAVANAKPEDWRYVTALGKVWESLKAQSDEMYQRLYDATPKSIALSPIDTPIGRQPGWYHPIIHDPGFPGFRSEIPQGQLFPIEYHFSGSPNGYTKERTGYRGPLSLDPLLVTSRLKQEIHDIAWRETVVDLHKLLDDRSFQATVTKHYGKAWADELSAWVKRLANVGTVQDVNMGLINEGLDVIRTNVVGTLIGLNPRTVQKHGATAFVNSILNSGVTLEEFGRAARDLLTGPEAGAEDIRKFMYEKSNEMPRRHMNMAEMAAGRYISSLDRGPGGSYRSLRQSLLQLGTKPVAIADLLSAEPLWVAAYRTARAEGQDEGGAVYFADRAVSRAHGSSALGFRPGIMVGGQGKHWLASIYGFTNHIMNRQYELAIDAAKAGGYKRAGNAGKLATGSLAAGFFAYYVFPGLIDHLVSPSQNQSQEGWGEFTAKNIATSTLMGYVGARDLAHAIIEGGDPTLGLTTVPLKDIMQAWNDMKDWNRATSRERAGRTIKDLTTAFGVFTGLTNAQEGKMAQYLWNVEHGVEAPKGIEDWYRGLATGSQSKGQPDLIERGLRSLPGR